MTNYKNLRTTCKKCNESSVQMNYCLKHYNEIVLIRFEKFMQFLLIKKNLSQSTIFLYVSDLVRFPENLFSYNDIETFNSKLLNFINSSDINYLKLSTIGRTRSALKIYLFYLGKENLMIVVDRIFIKQKQKNYDSLVNNKNTIIEYKYWNSEKILKDFVNACSYHIVHKNDILNKDDKIKILKFKNTLMLKHGYNKNFNISDIPNSKIKANIRNSYNRFIKNITNTKPQCISLDSKSSKVVVENSKANVLRNKIFILTLFMGGLRASESVWSRVCDVHSNHIKVLGKGFKYRKCILTPQMISMLQGYIKQTKKKDNDRLFVFDGVFNEDRNKTYKINIPKSIQMKSDYRKGIHLSMTDFYYIKRQAFLANRELEMIGKIAGVHLFPHSLRHSLATHLINKGLGLEVVQDILGHTDPKTTLRYAKIKDKTKEKGYLEVMEKI